MNSDPEVMRYLSAGRPETLEETRAIIGRVMRRLNMQEVGLQRWYGKDLLTYRIDADQWISNAP